jgi:hypothetical protein
MTYESMTIYSGGWVKEGKSNGSVRQVLGNTLNNYDKTARCDAIRYGDVEEISTNNRETARKQAQKRRRLNTTPANSP